MYQEWQIFFNEFIDALSLHSERKNEHYVADAPSPYMHNHAEYIEVNDIPEDLVLDIAMQDQFD